MLSGAGGPRRLSRTLAARWPAADEAAAAPQDIVVEHLVIGSGYGGAVAACRLAEAGHAVVLLERGSEFMPGEFPNDIALLPKFLRAPALRGPGVTGSANGLFDWQIGQSVVSLVANGLGGGSLINAGVVLEPDDDVWRQRAWPAVLRHDAGDGPLGLRQAIREARHALGAQAWPDGERRAKTRMLGLSAANLQPGATARPVELTIDAARCTRCGDCATGCNVHGAKLTLRDTYLARAAARGAELVCGAWVYAIEPTADAAVLATADAEAPRWRVTVLPTERVSAEGDTARMACGREARRFLARHVVIAAGTFGSTELLQRSEAICGDRAAGRFALSPALGTRFSGNGDSLSFAVDMPEPVRAEGLGAVPAARGPGDDPSRPGPTITAVVDLRRHTQGVRDAQLKPMLERLVVEDGATPAAIANAAREMLALQYTMSRHDHLRPRRLRAAQGMDALSAAAMGERTQVLLAMGHDGSLGRLVRLPERDRSVPWWPGDPADIDTYRAQAKAFAGLAALGGVHLHPPSWQLLPRSAATLVSGPTPPRALLTVHPLGGCPMADDFDDGVVDHRGRVWAAKGTVWPGLMVLDGSIVPTSLGVNPLLTITALAERAMAFALRELPRTEPARAALRTKAADETAPPLPAPAAFARTEVPEYQISLTERLFCDASRLRLRDGHAMHAEATIELGSDRWSEVWRDPHHRVQLVAGRLQLQSPVRVVGGDPQPPAQTLNYRMSAGRFDLLPQGRLPGLALRLWRLPKALLTWLLVRGIDDIRRARAAETSFQPWWQRLRDVLGKLIALCRSLAQATEARTMRYSLQLEREHAVDTAHAASDPPAALELFGVKHVRYAATWRELFAWLWRHGGDALRRGRGVPLPRPSYWQQVTDPTLVILPGRASALRRWAAARGWPGLARAWASGAFSVDAAGLLAQAPLLLHRGDLTGGLEAQSAYAMLFLRHALQTHLHEFRLPDYAGVARRDANGRADAILVRGRPVASTRHELRVARGSSEGEPHALNLPGELTLDLWHHRRPAESDQAPMLTPGSWYGRPVLRARSVLLLHAFGQSGAMYTLAEPLPSLARTLLEQGFDVWVLDHRISTRLPYTDWPSTIDQIACHDVPAALRAMIQQVRRDHANPDAQHMPIQVLAFGQCIGGASLAMSLLDGRLSHGIAALGAEQGPGPAPSMPMLAGAVISQTHPFLVASPLVRAKTWMPHVLRDGLGWDAVPLGAREAVAGVREAFMDRLFATLPVPDDERCPHERDAAAPQDDAATCRRIRFIEAPLFKHRNLSDAMHAELPHLFGDANLHLFAHAANCVEHERLVDNDGRGAYVRDDRWRQHFGLPVAFLHGAQNELFDVASARRSAAEHARLYPDMARRIAAGLDRADLPLPRAAAWILPGYGHVDPVLGQHAPRDVYAPLATLFERLVATDGAPRAPTLRIACVAAMPRSGPWIGHVEARRDEHGEGRAWRLRVRLAFHVDDRYSGGQQDGDGMPGTRSWAFVLVGRGRGASLARLTMRPYLSREERDFEADAGRCAGDTHDDDTVAADPNTSLDGITVLKRPGYRVADGELDLPMPEAGRTLWLRAFSVHETLMAEAHVSDDGALAAPACIVGDAAPDELRDWTRRLLAGHVRSLQAAKRRRGWLDPAWRPASRQTAERAAALRHVARLGPVVLAALRDAAGGAGAADAAGAVDGAGATGGAVAADGADVPRSAATVEFAASCCRYPGMAVDARRVDEAARELLACATQPQPDRPRPAFALLLGDQIYADATAGLVDSLNPVERYVQRHREAFAMGSAGLFGRRGAPQRALGDLMARVPTYLTQDDHEFRDGWPGSGPIVPGLLQGCARECHLVDVAHEAVDAFQRRHMPERIGDSGSYHFEQGAVRFFVIDTRTMRRLQPHRRILDEGTKAALAGWWNDDAAARRLNCLVSGSVLLPRLTPDNNPADPGEDSLAWHPSDRDALLSMLRAATHASRRYLLLSGDYHVSAAMRLLHGDRALGAAVVAPPLYAPLPYTNAPREALWLDEPLARHGLALQPLGSWDGSGFASLRVSARAGGGYEIVLRSWLRDHAQAAAAGRYSEPTRILLD